MRCSTYPFRSYSNPIYASDYPNEQAADIRHALCSFQARTDVSQRAKEKILRDNIKALYGI